MNHFSDNYKQPGKGGSTPLVRVLYRLKKYQYLLYKHCLLHGLNLSLALEGAAVAELPAFRLYWLCLNTAYVLEFFLQTLVKKGYMSQAMMIGMQQLLMAVSTFAALHVLQHVRVSIAALSLALNLLRRSSDVGNTACVGLVGWLAEAHADRSALLSRVARAKIGLLLVS